MKFTGTITAMVTPFKNNQLDAEGLAYNVNYQIEQGIDSVVVLGTTGEPSTLSSEEKDRVVAIAVAEASGKIPVIVGTGHNNTLETIQRTQKAKDLGASAALVIAPYYNKPSQEGLYRHYKAVAENVELPLIIYNAPGRVGVNIEASTVMRMADLPNVVGIKECSGNLMQIAEIMQKVARKKTNFAVLCGDDFLTLPMIALGAEGLISVASNLVPKFVMEMVREALVGNIPFAQNRYYGLLSLFKLAFIEVNPVPIKEAMHMCGMPAGECRLPLCELLPENREKLRQLLIEMELLKVDEVSFESRFSVSTR